MGLFSTDRLPMVPCARARDGESVTLLTQAEPVYWKTVANLTGNPLTDIFPLLCGFRRTRFLSASLFLRLDLLHPLLPWLRYCPVINQVRVATRVTWPSPRLAYVTTKLFGRLVSLSSFSSRCRWHISVGLFFVFGKCSKRRDRK